jgi:hypothetical protein
VAGNNLAKRTAGWLTATFTAVAVAVTPLPSTSVSPRDITFTNIPANDNYPLRGLCLTDIDANNVKSLTGFGDEKALREASALITQMNGRNGTPVAVLAILEASDATGVDFEMMIAKAIIESRLGVYDRPIGVNGSARGVYQFMPATWLKVFHDYAHTYKNGKYTALAQSVQFDRKGVPYVADKAKEKEILELRSDPYVASFLKAVYLRDEETAQLKTLLGRDPKAVDYYILHLLGLPRATTFFSRLAKTPDVAARPHFKAEARYNKGVFYNSKGRQRSFKQVHEHLDSLMQTYIQTVRDTAAAAQNANGVCVTPLQRGQEAPPMAEIPPPIPTARPPQEEIDKLLGKTPAPAANDNTGEDTDNTPTVKLPHTVPVPATNPRAPAP